MVIRKKKEVYMVIYLHINCIEIDYGLFPWLFLPRKHRPQPRQDDIVLVHGFRCHIWQAFTEMSGGTMNKADLDDVTRKEEDNGERGARKMMRRVRSMQQEILMLCKLSSRLAASVQQ